MNLSILDGWWAEAYDGTNGFAIGRGTSHVDDRITDARDAADLHRVLAEEVIPLYYDRDIDGLPRRWIERMMNSISSLGWRFSADRMVADYVQSLLPAGLRRRELRHEREMSQRRHECSTPAAAACSNVAALDSLDRSGQRRRFCAKCSPPPFSTAREFGHTRS